MVEKFIHFSNEKKADVLKQNRNVQASNELRNHWCRTLFIDIIGVLLNILILPGGIYFCLFLAAGRIDGANQISLFVCMIPIWIAALPAFLYVILHGLASQNMRINALEKFALSFVVPVGFLTSLIWIITYVEKKLSTKSDSKELKYILIPHYFSLVCLYLYLRCLVRPVRIQNMPTKSDN